MLTFSIVELAPVCGRQVVAMWLPCGFQVFASAVARWSPGGRQVVINYEYLVLPITSYRCQGKMVDNNNHHLSIMGLSRLEHEKRCLMTLSLIL